MPQPDNRQAILDQFTRQAVPFSTAPGIRDEEALRLLVTASGAGPADTVLDVACGHADRIRALFAESLADDTLGVGARRIDGTIHFAYPVAILVAWRER